MNSMHISIITSKQRGKIYRSKLLRRSYRDKNGTVQKQTLANLSHLPDETIELLRGSLKGKKFVQVDQAFEIITSRKHGAVMAIATAFERLALIALIGSTPCRERDLVCAMIASRIIRPHGFTKLAPPPGGGRTPPWPSASVSPMLGLTNSTPPWTGRFNDSTESSPNSRDVISKTADSSSTT